MEEFNNEIEHDKYCQYIDNIYEKAMNDDRFKKIKAAINGNKLKDALIDINSVINSIKEDVKKIKLEDIDFSYSKKRDYYTYDYNTNIIAYLNQLKTSIKNDLKLKRYDDEDDYILNKINNGNNINLYVEFDINKKVFNTLDIGGDGFPEFFKGLGLGKLVYKALVKKLDYVSLNGNSERISREADLLISSVLKDKDLYSFSLGDFIISFWNECSYDYIINILKDFYLNTNSNDNIQFDDDFLQKYNLNDKKLKEILTTKLYESITNKITLHYKVINDVINYYSNNGVDPVDYLTYLNMNESNFKLLINKIKSRCTIKDIEIQEDILIEDIKDIIRDRIAFINDISKPK